MSKYVTISAKVRKELKKEAENLGIKVSEVLRSALEDAVKRRKLEMLEDTLAQLANTLDKIDIEDIVRSIREDRQRR